MMFCWDCYKKHMNRMSKYGDPVGKPSEGIHRSHSMAESDGAISSSSSNNAFYSIKRHKSIDKLPSGPYSYNSLNRRASSSSEKTNEPPGYNRFSDSEAKSVTKRLARGRRSHKGRRSPSPPNNISPVRTSVVHSKRKHSPNKYSKPPTSWRRDVNYNLPNKDVSTAGDDFLPTGDYPTDPPIPPPGLFSPRVELNNPVDILTGRDDNDTNEKAIDDFDLESFPPPPPEVTTPFADDPTSYVNAAINGFHFDVTIDDDVLTESLVMQQLSAPRQTEESTTTSADEMAAIFANQTMDDDEIFSIDDNNNSKIGGNVSTQTIILPQFIDFPDNTSDISTNADIEATSKLQHQHQSSSGSSDKTGDTQIELDDFDVKDTQETTTTPSERSLLEFSEQNDPSDKNQANVQNIRNQIPPNVSSSDFSAALFLSPKRHHSSAASDEKCISYYLYPQSPSRLESIKLEFSEDMPVDSVDNTKLFFDNDARECNHPLRNTVFLKIPRGVDVNMSDHFTKVVAENIEIFPDTMSFLNGITQTIGENITMYKQGKSDYYQSSFAINYN